MSAFPKLNPRISLLPTIVAALGDPGADKVAQAFKKHAGTQGAALLRAWENMSERKRKAIIAREPMVSARTFKTRMEALGSLYIEARKTVHRKHRKLVRTEVNSLARKGMDAYQPSQEAVHSRAWPHEILRDYGMLTGANGCRCE